MPNLRLSVFRDFAVASALLMVTLSSQGQDTHLSPDGFHLVATGSFGALMKMGYTNPIAGFGAGLEFTNKRMLAVASGEVAMAHKIETKDGRSLHFDSATYKRFGRYLVGGGEKWSQEATSQWSKSSWTTFVAAGLESQDWRLQFRYIPGHFDVQNGLTGIQFIAEQYASRHFRVEYRAGWYRFHDTRVPGQTYGGVPAQFHNGAESGIALRFVY